MLQLHSITTKPVPVPVPSHCFVTPKSISLRGAGASTPTPTPTPTPTSLSIKCRHPELFQPTPFPSPPQRPSPSPPSPPPPPPPLHPVEDLPLRVFVDYSLYKGKGVLTVSPRPPEFTTMNSGAFKISKEGCVQLQFAPAVGILEIDSRLQYDWKKKQVFSLSVNEMGILSGLGTEDSCEFFQYTYKGKSDEGKLKKVLKVEPLLDYSGHMFHLGVVQNKVENVDESIFIPVTRAELAVFRSIFNFITPYLLGWNAFANSIKPEVYSRVNNANSRYRVDE